MYATPGSVASGASAYVTVGWMPPYDGGSPVTGYQVTAYSGVSSTIAATVVVPGSVTSAVVTNLMSGGSYTFTIRAVNVVGWGAESARSALITLATVPGAPTNVAAVTGIGSMAVSWVPPLSNGGSPITSYIVTASTGVAAETVTVTVNGSATSTMLTNLINGKTYAVTVTAVNGMGRSQPSLASTPVTLPTVPGAPQALAVTPIGASLQITWVAPAFTGGLAITGYLVTISDGIHPAVAMLVSGTSATFTGVATGRSYTVSVVAMNAIGAGSSVSQAATLPNLPPVLTVPADQTMHHGDRVSFTVSASDSEDHVVLTATGLPQGVTFTDLGNNTGQATGNAEVPAGTYHVIISAGDGHNPAVSGTVNIVVVRETAQIQLSSQDPMSMAIAKGKSTSGTVALLANIREVTDPNGNADIGEAAPVTYTLAPMNGGQTYSFTANRTGGGVEGSLQTSAVFSHLPPNVYRVHVEIGGTY
jgi:Fibronectin type III domain